MTFTNLLESNIPDADLLNLTIHVFIDFVWKGDLVWKRAIASYHSCSKKAKTIRLMLKITQFLTCLYVDSVIIHRSICLGWNVHVHRVISYLDTYHFIHTQSFILSRKLNSTSNISALENDPPLSIEARCLHLLRFLESRSFSTSLCWVLMIRDSKEGNAHLEGLLTPSLMLWRQ